MRILLVGAGGVGSAFCAIAARRDFFEQVVVSDYDESRPKQAADAVGESRFSAAQVDATSADAVAELVRRHNITHVMNAVDPRFVMPIFNGALAGGADYLDMAMSLSQRHPERPYELTGVKLGDDQFAVEDQWSAAGRLALVGIGVKPGLSDVFARYAADHLFSGGVEVSPRDVVAACLPNPATLGPKMHGKTCAGLWVTGTGKDGKPRSTYLYHIVDNQWSMAEYGHQCVVWQTAINPVVALELLANGTWSGSGVLGPEAFDSVPFLELLTAYGSPWGQQELTP
jgi:saccharopine dehydrogenase-like NADP-dependent oxidoreductase